MARILIVDDEQSLLDILDIVLEDGGHETYTANNGEDALRIMERASPPLDLVISDVMMPVMDGLKLLAHIRQNPAWVATKVILISAVPIPKKGKHRADMYLGKPYNLDAIEYEIEQLLKA